MSLQIASKDSASLSDFLRILRQRLALVCLILGVVLITTIVVTALLPRWYLATTKVRVEKPEGVTDENPVLTAVENGGAGRSKMVALGGVDLP